jgi:hypothetical protein
MKDSFLGLFFETVNPLLSAFLSFRRADFDPPAAFTLTSLRYSLFLEDFDLKDGCCWNENSSLELTFLAIVVSRSSPSIYALRFSLFSGS